MKTTISKYNFYRNTFCEFNEVNVADLNSLKWHHKSKSGSSYSFTAEGVYRSSNHWGRAANCRWRLLSNSNSKINNSKNKIGYAKWTDFYWNNETEKLFYIEVNFDTKEVTFQHKNNPNYDGKAVLRNASEIAKVIRQIKEILESDFWAKYFNFENLEEVRKTTIQKLMNTNIPLNKIKMDWN